MIWSRAARGPKGYWGLCVGAKALKLQKKREKVKPRTAQNDLQTQCNNSKCMQIFFARALRGPNAFYILFFTFNASEYIQNYFTIWNALKYIPMHFYAFPFI